MPAEDRVPEDDKHQKWLVLIMASLNLLLHGSQAYHVGVLNLAVLDTYHADPLMTSWLMALYVSMFAIGGPIASAVIDLTSCRVCVVLAGVLGLLSLAASSLVHTPEFLFLTLTLTGLSHSLSFMGGTVVLPFYFPTSPAIANGLYMVSSGIGSFIQPPLLQALYDHYGLRGAFLILGGLAFNACVSGMCMRPSTLEREAKLRRQRQQHQTFMKWVTLRFEMLKDVHFVLYLLANVTMNIGVTAALVYLPEYLVVVSGMRRLDAAMALSLLGVGATLSRLTIGFAASDSKIGEFLLFSGVLIISGVFCFLAPVLLQSVAGVYLFPLAFGIYAGGGGSLITPIVIRILGLQKASLGIGLTMLAFGLGGMVGPPITARLFHDLGYDVLFYFSGAMLTMSGLFGVMSTRHTRSSDNGEADNKMADLDALEPSLRASLSLHGSISYSLDFATNPTLHQQQQLSKSKQYLPLSEEIPSQLTEESPHQQTGKCGDGDVVLIGLRNILHSEASISNSNDCGDELLVMKNGSPVL